jgi:tetratricopeptide (TPR) repeat protein
MAHGLWQRQEISKHPLTYQPLSTLLPELHDLFPTVVYPTPLSPEQEQLRLWEATLELLNTISERTPLLLVLDDFHWADASSSELFAYLVRRLPGRPIILVGTYRDNELPATNPLRPLLTDLQREQVILSIPIQPLTDEQIASLLSHLPGTMVQYIQSRAAGNPFFAEELARTVETQVTPSTSHVVDSHSSRTIAPNQTSDIVDTHLTLPDTIAAVLELRMSRLTPACQRLLGNAAVLGGSFTFHVIQQMEVGVNANANEDTILDLLEEAIQAGVITEEGTGTRINYQFWHPLLVSHLYDQLSAARRARLHRRAAQVLQEVYRGHEQEGAAMIVNHLVAGGAEPLQVVHYAALAGDRSYNLSAYPEAEGFYRIAVAQLDEHIGPSLSNATQDERSQLAYFLERLGECTRVQGNYEEARHLYERVLAVRSCQRSYTTPTEYQYEAQIDALLWREIALTWYDVGDSMHAQECCVRGEQVLHEAGVVGGAAWAILRFQESYIDWRQGNYVVASAKAHEAMKLLVESLQQQNPPQMNDSYVTGTKRTLAGDPVNLGRIQTLIGIIADMVGSHHEALTYLQSALTVFEQYNRQREIANVCCNLGDVYLRKTEHELAHAAFRRSIHIAERIGDVPLMSVVFGNLGVLAARSGNLQEAEEWIKRGIKLAEQIKDQIYISIWHIYLSITYQDQGKMAEARKSIVYALSISRSTNNTPYIGFALIVIGNMHMMQSKLLDHSQENINQEHNDLKLEGLEETVKIQRFHYLKRSQHMLERALALEGLESETRIEGKLSLVQLFLLQGELNRAWQQAINTLEEARQNELIWQPARAQSLMGSILAAQGQMEQATKYFEEAIDVFRQCGMNLELARTVHSYGIALLKHAGMEQKIYQQGLSYLDEAKRVFVECGAALDSQQVERTIALYKDQGKK